MSIRRVLAGVGVVVAMVTGGAGAAGASPTPRAAVRSVVIDPGDPSVAYVTATYVCYGGGGHLWVSVKQVDGGSYDPALTAEGSSEVSDAWSQSHPDNFVCDGIWHTQTFRVDTEEQGFGTLNRGVAYVQFCLFDAAGGAVFDQHWRTIS